MIKPKIGLVGYFGWGNFGDELFVQAHKQHLSANYNLEVVHDKLEQPYFSTDAIEKLKGFDAFLIGGGDLVNPNAISTLYWREEYLRRPVFVHSIGCPNLKVTESKALGHLNKFFSSESVKYICLRDVESKTYFDNYIKPVKESVTAPDAVFALSLPVIIKNKNKRILGVVLRSHRSLTGEYENVRSAVNEAKRLGYKVRLIVAAFGALGEGDLDISKQFASEDEEIVYSNDLMQLCSALGECSLVLSMKFHAVVVGSMYGVPVIQLSTTQKNRNLFRYLQRPDLQGNYHDSELYRKIPTIPAPIHSLISAKLKRDSIHGYSLLKKAIDLEFS